MIFRNELIFVILIGLFVRKLQAQYPSVPCPEIFQYIRSGEDVVGFVTIKNVDYGDIKLEIKLSQLEKIESKNIGGITFDFDYQKAADYIASGNPFTYKVKFALKNVIPKVRAIRFNGVDICPVSEIPPSETIINLEHTIKVERPTKTKITTTQSPTLKSLETTTVNSSRQNDLPNFLKRPATNSDDNSNASSTRLTESSPTIASTSTNASITTKPIQDFNFLQKPTDWRRIDLVCGKENFDQIVLKLVVNGERVRRAKFPWIVAIYLRQQGSIFFQCGGSLITTRTVISAAHCFYLKNNLIINDESILVSMGRHSLDEWSNSDVIRNSDVEKIIRHPDYAPELDNNDADLAIVLLKERVTFSANIRPVCMWEGPLDVNDIEGTSGIVVGWGRDEKNKEVTTTPRLTRANVVSEINCIQSNNKFFHHTSNRTLCAGNRDGSGPCSGDSGSGLMIQVRNKWMLRGVVSLALTSEAENHGCDLKEYVVYADVAQFLGWIYANSVF